MTLALDKTDSDTAEAGGPTLPQVRKVLTEVPGPRSLALLERQRAAVPAGVGSVLPVFVVAAGGGVVVDADDNSFIDFGSGNAPSSRGGVKNNKKPQEDREVIAG